MKAKRLILLIDAIINLVLGVLLIFYSDPVVVFLGVPTADSAFYPSILGAVLFGIGIALLVERRIGGGLGLGGAVSINLFGGVVLGFWLLFGDLVLPFRGLVFLWGLVVVLVGVSLIEILASCHKQDIG